MAKLDSAELDAALNGVATLGVAPSQDQLIARLRASLAISSPSDIEDVRGMQLLAAIIRGHRTVVSAETLTALLEQRMHLVRADVCNARAVHLLPREPAIVLFSGLLKLLMYSISHRIIVAQLAKSIGFSTKDAPIESLATAADLPEPLSSLMRRAYHSKCAKVHFFRDSVPLPRLASCLTETAKINAMVSFCQSLWFLLMHELGHIRLGHLSGGQDHPPFDSPSLMIAEPINWMKQREFSADAYCIGTLSPESRLYALNYSMDVLTVFEFIENQLRPPRNTHPMALNRMESLLNIYGMPDDTFFSDALTAVSKTRKYAFDARGGPLLDKETAASMFERAAPREECEKAAARLSEEYGDVISREHFVDVTFGSTERGGKQRLLAGLWDHFLDRWWDTEAPLPSDAHLIQ